KYRIGINLGEIIVDGEDIYGDGVNIAARLEGLAAPGGIYISGKVYEEVRNKLSIAFEDLGEQEVKNIPEPVRVYRWTDAAAEPTTGTAGVEAAPPLPDKPSIAVLPFDNMSGDPEQEYFSDGITEDIITGLSQMRGLFVIARNSTFTYKESAVDVKRVGRDLGVRYVLEGSVRRGGDRVRVTAQLIDTGSGVHVWADRYDGTLDDVFTLQDDITAKVISAVGPEITLAEMERARSKRSESFDAWDRYLQALQPFYALDMAGYEEATALLREAIALDPRFSTAYATLARCHVNAGLHGWGATALEAQSKAEDYARQAVALDEQDPLAHVALGSLYAFFMDPRRAVNELNRAIELNPNLSVAHGFLSNALAFLGRSDEALAEAERANRGSPRDPERYIWYIGIMNAHFAAERYEECVEAAEQAVLLQPNFYGGHVVMAMVLPYLGRIEEAKQAVRRTRELMPRLTLKSTARNPVFVRQGDVERMLEGLRRAGLPE
ncbi:MAG: adenylate/guanylate cyclase domain-containing protein, partial [Alphaproteobacteria bacterium]|nr:adenylate/guanylate cyclase domain-containing protein [Alphaproteobacteria bacterium]